MIENKENYVFNEEENTVVKNFSVLKDGKQIAGGFVGISDEELLALYETNPELAEQDGRLAGLLEGGQETTVDPEPTQLDRIEAAVNAKNEEIAQAAIDNYTLELMEGGLL